MAGNTVTCAPAVLENRPGFNLSFRATIEARAEQCGTFPNTAEASGSVGVPNLPFRSTDTEQITVVGCGGGAAAPGAGGPGFTQEVEQEAQSGEVDLSFEVSNEGDYAGQCTPAEQFGQTGNAQNAPGFLQFGSGADDFEAGGVGFVAEPEQATDCASTIQQSSTASG